MDDVTVTDDAEPVVADDASPFRRRLLDGIDASINERGYRDTTVADIVRHARTSKRTFYDQFSSKEECFIELLRTNNEEMIKRIRGSVDPEADWQQQIAQAVGAYVDHIASRPAITLTWIREAPALGADAQPLHRMAMNAFTDMLVDLSDSPGFRRAKLPPITRPLALIIVGGLRELTALYVEDGHDVHGITEAAVTASTAILGITTSSRGRERSDQGIS
jgi:AcrR family transcriptional regulator